MKNVLGWLQMSLLCVGLSALPLAAQNPTYPNPGGDGTASQADANYRNGGGFDMGWLGLLGLAGLMGLRRRETDTDRVNTVPNMSAHR